MAGELGLLCHKHGGNRLCYKHGGSKLIFKCAAGGETTVTFAWGSNASDLDICAYWVGDPNNKFGYDWNESTSEHVSGAYHITYSGDMRGSGDSEFCKIRMAPWNNGGSRVFRVHFNYFGTSSGVCKVIASQLNGQTLIKSDQACSSNRGSKATTNDPYCDVVFDSTGTLSSIL